MARTLQVMLDDRLIGELSAHNDLWQFRYARPWHSQADAFALSPDFPLGEDQLDGASQRPVQWYFDNLLPEEGLRQVLAKEARIDNADAFGLLAYFGAESAGALTLLRPGAPAPAKGLRPLSNEALSARIGNLPNASLVSASPKRMSLAGAQHKMVLVLQDGAMFEPEPGTPSTFILKPESPSPDYPSSVINEHFVMTLADKVGLDVPRVERRYVPQPTYLVERFDRRMVGSQTQRMHVIDTCQLLGKSRSFKYQQATLDTLKAAIECTRVRAKTRQQLFRWLMFNFFVGNADNHLKNISYRVSAEGIGLAPFYDLLSTAVYDTQAFSEGRANWPRTPLVFSLGKATRHDEVTADALLQTGRELGLSRALAESELRRMHQAIQPKATELLEQFEADYEQLAQQSPAAAQVALLKAGELRLLRAIVYVVIAQTVKQVLP